MYSVSVYCSVLALSGHLRAVFVLKRSSLYITFTKFSKLCRFFPLWSQQKAGARLWEGLDQRTSANTRPLWGLLSLPCSGHDTGLSCLLLSGRRFGCGGDRNPKELHTPADDQCCQNNVIGVSLMTTVVRVGSWRRLRNTVIPVGVDQTLLSTREGVGKVL